MTDITADDFRTAAKVARRSIFTAGNPDLADAWDKAADQVETPDLVPELAKAMYEAEADYMNTVQGWSLSGWDRASELNRDTSAIAATAALAHLTSTGRLVPAGGMPLTAERASWVSLIVNDSNPMSLTADVWERVRTLFPATEPAEEPQRLAPVNDCCLYKTPECFTGHPAPAVRAEEETKAEDSQTVYDEAVSLSYWLAKQLGEHVDDASDRGETLTDTVQRLVASSLGSSTEGERKSPELWYIEAQDRPNAGNSSAYVDTEARANYYAKLFQDTGYLNVAIYPPVVPAPTETGPWQTWEAVPDGVTVKAANGERFRKTGIGAIHLYSDGVGDCCKISVATDLQPAPFIAAVEEGDA